MRRFALVAVSAGALLLAACSPQQKEADKLGFASVDEMHDIQTQGWHTKSQYLIDQNAAARKLGFADFDEMQSARKAGYVDKASWDKHLAQSRVDTPTKSPATDASSQQAVQSQAEPASSNTRALSSAEYETSIDHLAADLSVTEWSRCTTIGIFVAADFVNDPDMKVDSPAVKGNQAYLQILADVRARYIAKGTPESYLDANLKASAIQLRATQPADNDKLIESCIGRIRRYVNL